MVMLLCSTAHNLKLNASDPFANSPWPLWAPSTPHWSSLYRQLPPSTIHINSPFLLISHKTTSPPIVSLFSLPPSCLGLALGNLNLGYTIESPGEFCFVLFCFNSSVHTLPVPTTSEVLELGHMHASFPKAPSM